MGFALYETRPMDTGQYYGTCHAFPSFSFHFSVPSPPLSTESIAWCERQVIHTASIAPTCVTIPVLGVACRRLFLGLEVFVTWRPFRSSFFVIVLFVSAVSDVFVSVAVGVPLTGVSHDDRS